MKALVLSGGGARGAYQAGVLSAIGEMALELKQQSPFQIYTGTSAGAINASFLASGAEDFYTYSQKLVKLWSELTSSQVFKTDAVSLGKIGLSLFGELSFGGIISGPHAKSLLDTSPLLDLLKNHIQFSQITKNLQQKNLLALTLTALDYQTNETVTFVQGEENLPEWRRSRRHSEKAIIQAEHIMCSSAIPLLFSAGKVDDRYFADGCVRNQMPLRPALHLGADSLLVISVRKMDTTSITIKPAERKQPPSLARVVNSILNAVLLDGIEVDIERLNRINTFLEKVPKEHHLNLNFRNVDYVWVHPSEDIAAIASSLASRMPRLIRYLLKGLGPLDDAAEVISYLLFEPDFSKKLIDIGYKDAMEQKQLIMNFLKKG